jgi:hypothetical protein
MITTETKEINFSRIFFYYSNISKSTNCNKYRLVVGEMVVTVVAIAKKKTFL